MTTFPSCLLLALALCASPAWAQSPETRPPLPAWEELGAADREARELSRNPRAWRMPFVRPGILSADKSQEEAHEDR